MAITYMTGDIVELTKNGIFNVLVHGCNCGQVMGSGVAKQIRDAWPNVWEADCSFGELGDPLKLGFYSQAYVHVKADPDAFGATNNVAVVNAYIQYDYGYVEGARYVEYCAVANVFNRLASHYRKVAASPVIGLPRIGCGRAGGDWNCILRIIDAAMPEFDLRVVDLPSREVWQGRQL